jgi:FKBP12-rapamycin complex-associated protein
MQSITPVGLMGSTGHNVHLLARVYRTLGAWQWTLSPGLDDDSIQGACFLSPLISARNFEFFLPYFFYSFFFSFCAEILSSFRNATHYATEWGKAWHSWALFNTAVMSQYTLQGLPNVASQFVVSAVTGYFHSIACAANAKGVDDSLQVNNTHI